jgi:hypothetical protein
LANGISVCARRHSFDFDILDNFLLLIQAISITRRGTVDARDLPKINGAHVNQKTDFLSFLKKKFVGLFLLELPACESDVL